MKINIIIQEQYKTNKFFLIAEAESKRSFKISKDKRIYHYGTEVKSLEEVEAEKRELINKLKDMKHIINDKGIDTFLKIKDLKQGTKTKLKYNKDLIADVISENENKKELIIENYYEAGNNIYEIISIDQTNEKDERIKFIDWNNRRVLETSLSVFASSFELLCS